MQVVCDASIVVKWFHAEGEEQVAESRAILDAHLRGRIQARLLDLTFYELGNNLLRRRGLAGAETADRLDDLASIVGEPIALDGALRRVAAVLGAEYSLSYYDAAYAAAAVITEAPLISADRALLRTGVALTPADFVRRVI